MIDLTFDTSLMQKEMARLKDVKYSVQRALFPAVAEVIDLARADLSTRLMADLPVDPKFIKKSIKATQPRIVGQGVEASISVSSRPLPLIAYDIKTKQVTARKGQRNIHWAGFSYALRSNQRRQRRQLGMDGAESLPFIAAMRNSNNQAGGSGHLGIYRQTGAGQIKELYGPTVQYHATTPEMEAALIQNAEINFARILPRIINQVLAGASS